MESIILIISRADCHSALASDSLVPYQSVLSLYIYILLTSLLTALTLSVRGSLSSVR